MSTNEYWNWLKYSEWIFIDKLIFFITLITMLLKHFFKVCMHSVFFGILHVLVKLSCPLRQTNYSSNQMYNTEYLHFDPAPLVPDHIYQRVCLLLWGFDFKLYHPFGRLNTQKNFLSLIPRASLQQLYYAFCSSFLCRQVLHTHSPTCSF